jgi:O-methyltransferase involved in polyketide biosynthesis
MSAFTTPYDGIIPTGWMTAYGRSFTDIPHARDMFEAFESIRSKKTDKSVLELSDTQLAPQFEARYILLNRLIKESGTKQIMEVAAGLSTRGLELTAASDVTYVELDLPAMARDKEKVVSRLIENDVIQKRPNLHIETGNAVSESDMHRATRHFDPVKPVVIVNEGLLRYFSMEDKARYAKNVAVILGEFGGTWITSDVSVPRIYYQEKEIMASRRKKISGITGIDISKNLFKGPDDAERFFRDLGFKVKRHSFFEVFDELTSPEKLNVSRSYAAAITKPAVAFVMVPV